jgi:hypothetical protein
MGFGGLSNVKSLPSGISAAVTSLVVAPAVATLSGVTVAGTSNLKTLLSLTGSRARLNALAFTTADSTPRNVRVVITVDGVVVLDSTVACNSVQGRVVVGMLTGSSAASGVAPQPVDALNELKVQYACSLAETDKLTFLSNYEVRG